MKKCILFIHGLGSNTKETWGDIYQLINNKKEIDKNIEYQNITFKDFEYPTEKLTSPIKLSKSILIKIAKFFDKNSDKENLLGRIEGVSDVLKNFIETDLKDFNHIEIVAHSMGGLIATRYILNRIMNKEPLKVNRILYICTPFIGSYFADIAKKIGLSSPETSEMIINSDFLKTLIKDMKMNDFDSKINHLFLFGLDDDIIIDYRKALISHETQRTLKGDHNTILKYPLLVENFKFIEYFFLEKDYKIFIDKLYSKIVLNDNLRFSNNYKRKINQQTTLNQFSLNFLEKSILDKNEYKLYSQMDYSINNHSFSPHKPFEGKNYFVPILENERILENYWDDIKDNNFNNPFLYIGNRGSGKTITQNVWLSKNFKEMEDSNIFHVRCDIHKIYDMLHESFLKLDYRNLAIESYLDIQFLYIFLKYRSSEYNTKGKDEEGISSKLMQKIDKLLDKNNKKIVANSKFEDLGSFLDKQSENIYHSEVSMRGDNRKYNRRYSYAVELMRNIIDKKQFENDFKSEYSEFHLNKYEVLIENIVSYSDNLNNNNKLNEFIEFIREEKELLINEIQDVLSDSRNQSRFSKISALKSLFSTYLDKEYDHKVTTTRLWLDVSSYIQEVILSQGYKILKLVDGIDNIIIHESSLDKKFFNDKLDEICNIVNRINKENVFFFITLRHDTLEMFKNKMYKLHEKLKAGYGDGECTYSINYHQVLTEKSFSEIKAARFNALQITEEEFLYTKILKFIFVDYYHTNDKLIKIDQVRMLLRNLLFLSLQVYFEFVRRKEKFSVESCLKYIKQRFKETFFLRNQLYLKTGASISSYAEDKYKIFPNIFFVHNENKKWIGFCSIYILTLLITNQLTRKDILYKLDLYEKEIINDTIDLLLDYNMISSTFCEEFENVTYLISHKGLYFFDIINNLDVLYYLSLDTPLPEKFVNPLDIKGTLSYFSIFKKSNEKPINTGYSNSIIKSVLTFVLFLKYIYEYELLILEQKLNQEDLINFKFPIDLEKIEKDMKTIHNNTVKDFSKVHEYLKFIGLYDDYHLENDLKYFNWVKKNWQ